MMNASTGFLDFDWWCLSISEYIFQPVITVLLCLLSVFVVLGNLLVVSAIWHENQMHSVTNYLIASLAAADCLVGAVVMPFSIISEIIIGSWTFGETWCDLWHSFDVLASTASIMNLCAISWDRYLAITDPISYPTRMTPKTVALYIVSLWISSSLISFPAILWWRAVSPGPLQPLSLSSTNSTPATPTTNPISSHFGENNAVQGYLEDPPRSVSLYKCVFTDDTYYLLFSSTVSFYGPLCVMLYAYHRIYRAAVQQTRFLKHGSKQVMIEKGKKSKRSRYISEHSFQNETSEQYYGGGASNLESQHLVLRAHRGGGASSKKPDHGDSTSEPNSRVNSKKRDIEAGLLRSSIDSESKEASPENFSALPEKDGRLSGGRQHAILAQTKRRGQLDSRSSRRDKMRVDCQRFDVVQERESTDADLDEGNEEALEKHATVASSELSKQLAGAIKPGEEDMTNSPRSGCQLEDIVVTNNVRPSLSVSSTNSNQNRPHEPILTYNGRTSSSSFLQGPVDKQTNDTSSNLSDALMEQENESSASSGTSESFGTGSVISVRMKPESVREKSSEKLNCDINFIYTASDSRTLEHYARKGRGRKGPLCGIDKQSSDFDYSTEVFTKPRTLSASSINPKQLKLPCDRRHRASCADPSATSDIVRNIKATAKPLNIKSWVKFSRRKSRCESPIKPPPSLLPLMMMNSDTSTDSSIMGQSKSINDDEGPRNIDPRGDTQISQHAIKFNSNSSARGKASALGARRPVSKSEGGAEMSVKCQVLHYDSNKLTQSIVDLNSIHYIDCSGDSASNHDTSGLCVTPTIPKRALNQAARAEEKETNDSTSVVQNSSGDPISDVPRQSRGVGKKLSKLAKERKAAKTLGIVVGVFVLCWLPFFVMNIIVALLGAGYIYKFQLVSQIVTWLGWLNSAMNPVIYACWSRDFRRAFRRVLCAWVEFICPYESIDLARKLKLKKTVNYSPHEGYLNRNISSFKGNSSSLTLPSGVSVGEGRGCGLMNGGVSRNLLSDR